MGGECPFWGCTPSKLMVRAADVLALLAQATSTWSLLEVSEAVARRAEDAFPNVPVRTLDAVHLASAIFLRQAFPDHAILAEESAGEYVVVRIQPAAASPGQEGRRRMVLANAGPRPFRRLTLTQDHLVEGGFSDALQLQVYDAITRRCLYPRPPARLRVPRVRVEPDRCMQWMPFDGRSDMRFLTVPGKDGSNTWRRTLPMLAP